MFHGGDGAEAGANNCKPLKQILRQSQHVLARLASGLLLEWADGSTSARLQQHCSHAQEDALTHPTVQRLAGVGTAQNAHYGLMSLLWTCDIQPLITRMESGKVMDTVLPSTWTRLLRAYPVQFSLRLGADIQSTRAFWSQFLAMGHTKAWADKHFLFEVQNRGRSRPRCSADRHDRRKSFQSAERLRCDKFLVVAGTRTREAYRVPLWKLCQAIWWTNRYWCLGSFDRRLVRAAGGSPVAVGDDGAVWRFLLLCTKSDAEARCNEFGTVLTKCAANVCPITCARMQRGESPKNYHGTFTKFAQNVRCTFCSAARSSVTVPS